MNVGTPEDAAGHSRSFLELVLLSVLLALFAVYAGIFIYRTSFLIDGVRYFSLVDDAMISMRYAKNLVNGYGLLWNPGCEPVEGFTNPLWTIWMALAHKLFPCGQTRISLVIQISSAVLLAVNVLWIYRIARLIDQRKFRASLGAAALTAFYLPLNHWSLRGMETGLQALLISMATLYMLRQIRGEPFSLWFYVILGTGLFVRIDMTALYLFFWIVALLLSVREKRARHFWAGFTTLVLCLGSQTLFRLIYYHDVLPNTYYLKMTGYPAYLRMARGGVVFGRFLAHVGWCWIFLPRVLLGRLESRRPYVMLLGVFCAQAVYSVYVGGDAWEGEGGSRYLAVVTPLLFVLFAHSINTIPDRLFPTVNGKPLSNRWKSWVSSISFSLLMLGGLLQLQHVYSPSRGLQVALFKKEFLQLNDAGKEIQKALALSKVAKPEARVAVVWAGTLPYFCDLECVDLLGKSDRHVARLPMRVGPMQVSRFEAFYPGHMKFDYNHSILELKPDVVIELWWYPKEALKYLLTDYTQLTIRKEIEFCVRKGSPDIRWDSPMIDARKDKSVP